MSEAALREMREESARLTSQSRVRSTLDSQSTLDHQGPSACSTPVYRSPSRGSCSSSGRSRQGCRHILAKTLPPGPSSLSTS